MKDLHNRDLTFRAQELRTNATKQEKHLWYDDLNRYPVRFRRQVTIDRFIVDYLCAKAMLVLEVDGSHIIRKTAKRMTQTEQRYWNHWAIMYYVFQMMTLTETFLACAN